MTASKLVTEFEHALVALAGLDEDREVEAWDRIARFKLDAPDPSLWDALDVDSPPRAFTLMVRRRDGAHELLWQQDPSQPLDACPVVELTTEGETQVLATSFEAYLDALLFTNGQIGGGSADDLDDARDEAGRMARELAEELLDELDRDLADPEELGDAWEEAQEDLGDLWADAAEGLD